MENRENLRRMQSVTEMMKKKIRKISPTQDERNLSNDKAPFIQLSFSPVGEEINYDIIEQAVRSHFNKVTFTYGRTGT